MKKIVLENNKTYSIEDVCLIAENKAEVIIAKNVLQKVRENCAQVQQLLSQDIYGLTTGVADLSMEKPTASLDVTQKNILLSHSVGVGEYLPKQVVRGIIFSRLIALSQGMSGISGDLLVFLAELLNKDVIPLAPSIGSIGLSDLTILAGAFVILCDKGKVVYKNKEYAPFEAFKKADISYPKQLQTREGLALINGNNGAIALACLLIQEFEDFILIYLETSALSLEARGATFSVFNPVNQQVKPFKGQKVAATYLAKLLKGSSQIANSYANTNNTFLQDPPSFKTIAQMVGSVFDTLENAKKIIDIELNSITDNPIFVTKSEKVEPVSSGNYLCAQLATILDQISLVLSSLAESSVARMKILLNDEYSEGLPKYLIEDSTNNSGFMICVYTAESVLSEIKSHLYPRSTFETSVANGWEDVSTNAFNVALNAKKIYALVKKIQKLELALALQGMALRKNQNSSVEFAKATSKIFKNFQKSLNKISLPIENDEAVNDFISKVTEGESLWN